MEDSEALAFILDHECYNPDEDWGTYDVSNPGSWERRKYRLEGHCVNYAIVATRKDGLYSVLSIEIE